MDLLRAIQNIPICPKMPLDFPLISDIPYLCNACKKDKIYPTNINTKTYQIIFCLFI